MAEKEKEEEKKETVVKVFVDDRQKKIWRRNPKFTQPVHNEEKK